MDWGLPDLASYAPHRRREVAGPYRSQSSVPQIRRAATHHEHRRVNPFDHVHIPPALPPTAPTGAQLGLVPPPVRLEDPYTAYDMARLHGVQPPAVLRREYHRDYGPGLYGTIEKAALGKLGGEENVGQPADLTNLALLLATAGGSAYLRGALSGAEAGAGALAEGGGAESTSTAAQALRAAAKIASLPVRRPGLTAASPLAAQVPVAALKGNPAELGKAFTGKGLEADLLSGAGDAVTKAIPGVAGHTIADALSLPAQVLPSTYLTSKAGVEALAGDPKALQELRGQYQHTSALPALLRGEVGEAANRAQEHPLYTLLEGAAVKAGLGLSAGELLRRAGNPNFQHEARPNLVAYGDVAREQGRYSRDAISRVRQRRADERRPVAPDGQGRMMRPREMTAHLNAALDREVFAGEQVRRGGQRQVAHELEAVRPRDKAQADVVSHAIQGIARNPDRAIFDLQGYREELLAQQPHLTASELTANRKQIETIDAALANPNPDAIYAAVRTFVEQQKPITEGLVERGLLDAGQARKATAIPYARVHMDAGYGLSRADVAEEASVRQQMRQSGLSNQDRGKLLGKLSELRARHQTLDPAGNPLSLDAIESHMRDNGLAPGDFGFVTQRPAPKSGAASFFQPSTERASLQRGRRTGEATAQGTFDPSWESVVQQAIHGRTILDRVRNFEHVIERFGLRAPDGRAFKDSAEAKRAAEHPEDFGMQLPDVPGGWRPIRLSPWLAKKSEIEAAADLGHNTALEADHTAMVENFSNDAIKNALEPGDGPVVLIPASIAKRWRQHNQELFPGEKAAQAVTGTLKGAWLPTSPKWIAGNALDNFVIRSFATGITPHDMVTGKRFAELFTHELSRDEQARALESIVPGGLFGSYARVQPYRALEQFVGTRIEPTARAAHAVLSSPGVRTAASLYRRYRDTVFEFDSKYIEQLPQYGQLAKSARRELDLTRRQFRKAVAAQDPAVMDFIRGFRKPETIDRFAREVEEVFGNWGKNGPEARRFLNTYAPFWMWGRAAFKFAFMTMPRDHPILTGMLAATEQMTREERQKLGLDFVGHEQLPGFLQGSIPTSSGGVVGISGLSTYGTFADLPEFLANSTTPQIATAIMAMRGLDWKGDQLVDSQGRPAGQAQRAQAAVTGTLESFLPFLNVARSIGTHGAAGVLPAREYPASTVDYLRGLSNTQQIRVPIEGSSGSGSEGSSNPFDSVDLGGSSTNPFDSVKLP